MKQKKSLLVHLRITRLLQIFNFRRMSACWQKWCTIPPRISVHQEFSKQEQHIAMISTHVREQYSLFDQALKRNLATIFKKMQSQLQLNLRDATSRVQNPRTLQQRREVIEATIKCSFARAMKMVHKSHMSDVTTFGTKLLANLEASSVNIHDAPETKRAQIQALVAIRKVISTQHTRALSA